jgi:hypothetical protein
MVMIKGARHRRAAEKLASEYGSCVPADETPEGEARITPGRKR